MGPKWLKLLKVLLNVESGWSNGGLVAVWWWSGPMVVQ
jgi:hypothetical protein